MASVLRFVHGWQSTRVFILYGTQPMRLSVDSPNGRTMCASDGKNTRLRALQLSRPFLAGGGRSRLWTPVSMFLLPEQSAPSHSVPMMPRWMVSATAGLITLML